MENSQQRHTQVQRPQQNQTSLDQSQSKIIDLEKARTVLQSYVEQLQKEVLLLKEENASLKANELQVRVVEKPIPLNINFLSTSSTENVSLKALILLLINSIVLEEITSNQAQHLMHKWHSNLPLKTRQEFVVNRSDTEETINYFKQVLDTLAQEVPSLLMK